MKQYIVTAESLNVRSGPSSDDPKVWVFPFGKIITQVSTNPDSSWIEVKLGEIQGWVSSQFLSEVPAGTIETDPSTLLGNDLGIDWFKWNQKAMLISASFEGHGADWGNPVGNFDRAFLTCGLLGFTWEWNNQPPMVMEFVVRQGKAALTALMPTKGAEYLDAVILGSKQAAPIVSSWSIGEKVVEPYHSELKTFWSSDAMKKIQTETSVSMFAKFAKRKTTETQRYYGLATPQFAHFA